MTATDSQAEQIIDRRVQARLATDSAYRNAENADEQAQREDEITAQEEERFYATFAEPDKGREPRAPAAESTCEGRPSSGSANAAHKHPSPFTLAGALHFTGR